MLRSAGSTPVTLHREVLFNDQPKPVGQIRVGLLQSDVEICFLCKQMAGPGRKSHVLAKVMLEDTYLGLNLGSATYCVTSSHLVRDS